MNKTVHRFSLTLLSASRLSSHALWVLPLGAILTCGLWITACDRAGDTAVSNGQNGVTLSDMQAVPKAHRYDAGLRIVDPSSGAAVPCGSSLRVKIEPQNGFEPTAVEIVCASEHTNLKSAPFVAEFSVPATRVGRFSIRAYGADSQGRFTVSNTVNVSSLAPSELVSITIDQPLIARKDVRSALPRIRGRFADGVDRHIEFGALHFDMHIANPEFVSINDDGSLEFRSTGKTRLTLSQGKIAASVDVYAGENEQALDNLLRESRTSRGPASRK